MCRYRVFRAALGAVSYGLVLWSIATPNAIGATLEALPEARPEGSEVLLRGTGYRPQSEITIQVVSTASGGLAELGRLTTDSTGRLFGWLPIPDSQEPGAYRVRSIDAFGTVSATVPFTVESPPSLMALPDIAPPGTEIRVDFGPVDAGQVSLIYAGVPLLGPVSHPGGIFTTNVLIPADRPDPLGSTTLLRAELTIAGHLAAVAEVPFTSQPEVAAKIALAQFSGPGEPLSPGELFEFSGQLIVPSNRDPRDYSLTLAMRAADDSLIPVNIDPIAIDAQGFFSGEAVAPSPVSGTPIKEFGQTTELGLVYRLPGGESGFLNAVEIEYQNFEAQNLRFRVVDQNNQPVETAVVNVFANTMFVPEGWNFEEDGIPGVRVGSDSLQKPTFSALYASPNQYHEGIQEITQSIAMITNDVTGCPVTLTSGLTDSLGEFEVNAVPFLNYLLDKGAQSVSNLGIKTTVNGPGKATFSVKLGALHLGLGLVNDRNECTGQRWDFQYDYETDLWKLRDGLNGDFTIPFDPNVTQITTLGPCPPGTRGGIPAKPYMPGLPAQEVAFGDAKFRRFGAIWSFPQTDGASLIFDRVPQFRLPHLPAVFGLLENPTLFLNNVEIGPLEIQGAGCGQDGVDYVIDLPDLITRPPGIVTGRVEANMLDGTPVSEIFQLDIRAGPTWINNTDFVNRVILWDRAKVSLSADESGVTQTNDANNLGFGLGDLENNNLSEGTLRQVLLPTGAAARRRVGASDAVAADEPTDMVENQTSGTSSSPDDGISIGNPDELIEVLDTGKIPLFRWSWGISPIAAATVGADVWFKAMYRYFGEIVSTNQQVLVDLTTEAIATAGLDLFFDVSVILDLVSFDAEALPAFGLGMPIVISDNQFDANASKPCFEFDFDVAWEVHVGWCPFCVKAGGTENLFDVNKPDNCNIAGLSRRAASRGLLDSLPQTDKVAISVDGLGSGLLAWGDSSGLISVQQLENGALTELEQLPAGPGAMAPALAHLDSDTAVLVWAESALSEADFLALDGDPNNPLDGDVAAALTQQRLVYRVREAGVWGPVQPLTGASGGEGGVVVSACTSNCPPGGEALAVWSHDPAGDYSLHQMKLRYAFFDGVNWTAPAPLEPGATAKQSQPAVAWLNGDPVVWFVQNDSVTPGGSFDLNQRRLAYVFPRQGAGVQIPATLPAGVASPSVQPVTGTSLVVAFSAATESDAFLGWRRSLRTGFATQCFAGVCNVGSAQERTDSLGRRIFVERPILSRNLAGQGVITFRHLGTDEPRADDPEGVLQHTGQLMQLVFDINSVTIQPNPVADPVSLILEGGSAFRTNAAFDPALNTMIVASVEQAATGRSAARSPVAGVQTRNLAGSPVLLSTKPMLPDFELIAAALDAGWIDVGQSAMLTVNLRNNGPAWSEPQALTLATYWDGPPGLGQAGPALTIDELPTASPKPFQLEIPLPGGFLPDDEHRLHVVLNPNAQLLESDATNNARQITVGALPVPTGLQPVDGDASGTIVIHWIPVNDSRVTGYRVYRRNPDGSELIVGSSPVAGFADFSAYPEQHYEYFVTSHSARLMESTRSEPVPAFTFDPDLLFRDGYE